MFLNVLQPLFSEGTVDIAWAYAVAFEYLRCLQKFRIPVETYIFVQVIELLLDRQCSRHVLQLLQYHVPPDSIQLARRLLTFSRDTDLRQAGMDMLIRLAAYEEVVAEMLEAGQVLCAMRFILRHSQYF